MNVVPANNRLNPEAISTEPPKITPMVRSAIADPYGLDTGAAKLSDWRPPSRLPPLNDLQQALAALQAKMAPATETWIIWRLAKLSTMTASDTKSSIEARVRVEETAKMLDGYPVDIWEQACVEWLKQSEFFPRVVNLSKIMEPELWRRKRGIERLQKLIEMARKPQADPQSVREPKEVRWRKTIDYFLSGNLSIESAAYPIMRKSAINAEHELAAFEGREVADWAKAS